MKAHSLKAPYFEIAQRFSRNSEKFAKFQGELPRGSLFLKMFEVYSCRYTVPLLELDYAT